MEFSYLGDSHKDPQQMYFKGYLHTATNPAPSLHILVALNFMFPNFESKL